METACTKTKPMEILQSRCKNGKTQRIGNTYLTAGYQV